MDRSFFTNVRHVAIQERGQRLLRLSQLEALRRYNTGNAEYVGQCCPAGPHIGELLRALRGQLLNELIGLLSELRSRDIDFYLHQQALDTSTPSGRMLFGMLSAFSEFERSMIRDRVMAGLDRARSTGKRLGRPPTTPFTVQRIRAALDEGRGVRETARLLRVSPAKMSEVRRMAAGDDGLHP